MIAGILLAAGTSHRFGAPKLLHPLADGTPMALAALRALLPTMDRCLAVVRPEDAALIELLAREGADIVRCETADRGMGASLACGVAASRDADGWLIGLADMPYIAPASIRAVAERLRAGAMLAAPVHQGRRGHPVGFGREFFAALTCLDGDQGARAILDAHAARLACVPVDDPGVLADIDTPAQVRARV